MMDRDRERVEHVRERDRERLPPQPQGPPVPLGVPTNHLDREHHRDRGHPAPPPQQPHPPLPQFRLERERERHVPDGRGDRDVRMQDRERERERERETREPIPLGRPHANSNAGAGPPPPPIPGASIAGPGVVGPLPVVGGVSSAPPPVGVPMAVGHVVPAGPLPNGIVTNGAPNGVPGPGAVPGVGASGAVGVAGPPAVVARLNENFDVVRQEFEMLNAELGLVRNQRDEFEAKVQSQVNELNIIRQALYDLESQHGKVRQQFEEELARVRAELHVAKQQVLAAQNGGGAGGGGPGGSGGPAGGSGGGRDRERDERGGGGGGSGGPSQQHRSPRQLEIDQIIRDVTVGKTNNGQAYETLNDSVFYTGRERDVVMRDIPLRERDLRGHDRERERGVERQRLGGERDGPRPQAERGERDAREGGERGLREVMLREREQDLEQLDRERDTLMGKMREREIASWERDREKARQERERGNDRDRDRLVDSRDPKRVKSDHGLPGPSSLTMGSRRERVTDPFAPTSPTHGLQIVPLNSVIGPTPKLPPIPGTTNTGSAAVTAAANNTNNPSGSGPYGTGYQPSESRQVVLASRESGQEPHFPEDFDHFSLPPECRKEGQEWFAMFNPKMKRRMDISLMHTLIHESVVCCVRFSADGKYLATGCNRTAQIYDTKTGAKTCVLVDENAGKQGDLYIRSVCFSPDGQYLATGAEDKQIRIWDIAKRRIRNVFDGHQQEIYSLEFSLDGRLIVSGSGDKTARIWDMVTLESTVLTINDPIPSESSHGDDAMDIDGGDSVLPVAATAPTTSGSGEESGGSSTTPHNNDGGVTTVAISPDSRYVASGSLDRIVRIWELTTCPNTSTRTGTLVERLRGHRDSVYSVAFTPDGKGLVSGSLDRTIKYWDISHLGITPHKPSSGSSNSTASSATIDTHRPSSKPPSTSSTTSSPTKKPPGHGFIGLAKCTSTFVGHKDYVLSVAVSGDGQWVVSGSKDRGVQFWDLAGVSASSAGANSKSDSSKNEAGSKPGHEQLGTAVEKRRRGDCACALQGHKNSVISIDLSPVGSLLATGSGDWQARIWNYQPSS
ncbi:transcriptional repressor [Coprinopsis cinerea okayama7|uniref:Transcriptional repressor n=1 Tax=Coprinopsis cinerea (strain Okayama-7 / 130 / ATCC MYA-4618 / FGSC 9003) TaxID=240176 RepID=A8NCV9_COPC7|nr:transcriptional repressor [Coprinopsis cinerea okayama7\|eukprot:XP_001832640.1 transcriptional repressor [Coprinopsis cinerea okayama7\